jgi:hypothetical protein
MENRDSDVLERFLKKNQHRFTNVDSLVFGSRSLSFYDILLRKLYFLGRTVRNNIK